VGSAGASREVGEKGLRLARRQGARALVGPEEEAAQDPKAELGHFPSGSTRGPERSRAAGEGRAFAAGVAATAATGLLVHSVITPR
jgi:hypothetical protein